MSCIHNNYCAFPEKITRIWCKAIGRKEINKSSETSSPLLISFNSFLESVRLFCLRERYAESETLKAISGHGCLVVMHHPSCRYEVERWYLLGNSICKGQKMITGPHSPLILHWTRQHALTCSPAMKTKRLTMNVPPFSCRRILLSFPFSDEEKEIATSITGTLSAFTWLTSFLLRIHLFFRQLIICIIHNSKEFFQTMCALYTFCECPNERPPRYMYQWQRFWTARRINREGPTTPRTFIQIWTIHNLFGRDLEGKTGRGFQ